MRQTRNNINSKSEILNIKQTLNSKVENAQNLELNPVVKSDLKSFLALFRQFVLVGGDLA